MSLAILLIIIVIILGLMINLFEAFRRAKPPANFKKREYEDDDD